MGEAVDLALPRPIVAPLGDCALVVRFAHGLDDRANQRAVAFAAALEADPIAGVVEVVPSLVSVLLRYDPRRIGFMCLSSELSLRSFAQPSAEAAAVHRLEVRFGSEAGPDLVEVAQRLGLASDQFIARHNAARLRVLTTGFAPGFVYCGFHDAALHLPRRTTVRQLVPAGSVLFAAGQTAIAATAIPTGWHVIGRTAFRNFDPAANPPTQLRAGDAVIFEAAS